MAKTPAKDKPEKPAAAAAAPLENSQQEPVAQIEAESQAQASTVTALTTRGALGGPESMANRVMAPLLLSSSVAYPAVKPSPILINGFQLREALEYLAPDDSAEQLADELSIVYSADGGHSGPGLYAHHVECPEEGSILLTGAGYELPRQPSPSAISAEIGLKILEGWPPVELSAGIRAVLLERLRVVNEKGRTTEMDDAYTGGELVQAAACYAGIAAGGSGIKARAAWPFDLNTFKPGEPTRDLIKAAQFLIAELDRRQRAGDPLLNDVN